MFVTQTVPVNSVSTPVNLTSGIDTDPAYVITIRMHVPTSGSVLTVIIGDASITSTNGYFLTAGPASVGGTSTTFNPEITLRLQGEDVYAIATSSGTFDVDVLVRSDC